MGPLLNGIFTPYFTHRSRICSEFSFFHFFGDAKLPINSEHLSCFSKGGEFFPSSSIGCLLHREKGLAF